MTKSLLRRNHTPPVAYWKYYENLSDTYDREMVRDMRGGLDTLLIVAVIFSTIDTAFITAALSRIDPSATDVSNTILWSLANYFDNSSSVVHEFHAAAIRTSSIATSCIFGASLACSMVASLGALVAKQWLVYYERDEDPIPEPKRRGNWTGEIHGRQRQKRFSGLEEWHLRPIVNILLPSIFQLAIILFFVGLIHFSYSYRPVVAWLILGIVAFALVVYLATVLAGLQDPCCPFQTPLSVAIYPRLLRPLSSAGDRLRLGTITPFAPNTRKEDDVNSEKLAMYSPSVTDVQATSWMIATARNYDALLCAAQSLPFIDTASMPTIANLHPKAVYRLCYLLRDSLQSFDLHRSRRHHGHGTLLAEQPATFARALFHLFLSSQCIPHVQYEHPWRHYQQILHEATAGSESANHLSELWVQQAVVDCVLDGELPDGGWRTTLVEPDATPLYVAGIIAMLIVDHQFLDSRDPAENRRIWEAVLGLFEDAGISHSQGPSFASGSNTKALHLSRDRRQVPLNVVNMVAWALGTLRRPHTASSVVLDLYPPSKSNVGRTALFSELWDAYTRQALF
ncbi:hypothetical protein FRB99_008059 [Tulasnella sp. 403]|nr:hypothetical protein FRB99_008059 [Tulasnella sp. 403]